MELVLRPVHDDFLQQRVLPFLSRAMHDAPGALGELLGHLEDESVHLLCEQVLSSAMPGGLRGVEPEPWAELVDRLVFPQWGQGPQGWRVVGQRAGYAGGWAEALHLALMVEEADYPYWDEREVQARCERWRLRPPAGAGLASLVAGLWEPVPDFPPAEVFTTQGRGEYHPELDYAFADWAWRPSRTVQHWQAHLRRKLERLLAREQARLQLPSLPERDEVLAYWCGQVGQPPPLTVAFSGLGRRSPYWVTELGVLTAQVREATLERAALVALVTKGFKARD